MQLQHELLLTYPGIGGAEGICHLRAYEHADARPVVIVGELTDNPGTFVPNAIENIAAAVQRLLYADGREFQLIQHRPPDEFLAVTFDHISPSDNPRDPSHRPETVVIVGPDDDIQRIPGSARHGDFRNPKWTRMDMIETLTGGPVQRWDPTEYTAVALGGSTGELLRESVANRARAAGSAFGGSPSTANNN